MANLRELTVKTVKTLQKDGPRKVGEKARRYFKRRQTERQEAAFAGGDFREVLFVNGCDERLPHPGRYRVSHQREELESLGISTGEVYFENLKPETVRCYRVFIFFRCPCTETIREFVEEAKRLNKTVLYDVDDLVFDTVYTDQIPYLASMGQEEREQYDENVRSMGRLLSLCQGAVTTTACLAEELEKYVPRVLINRNAASEEMAALSREALACREEAMAAREREEAIAALDREKTEADLDREMEGTVLSRREEAEAALGSEGAPAEGQEENQEGNQEEYQEESQKKNLEVTRSARARLGYFSGSITHNDDLAMILPVLTALMEEYENLELHLTGELDLPQELEPFRERIKITPFVDWRELPALLASVDINLAPLRESVFNRAKSENKWVEAALVKIPTVASDTGAFQEMVENGRTGILCRNEQEWLEALRALIDQPQYRALIGEAAFRECSNRCVTAWGGQNLLNFIKEMERPSAVFFLPGFQVSGGVMVALQHARLLQESGWDVTLFSIDEEEEREWYEFEGTRFPVLGPEKSRILGTMDCGVATMWSTCPWLDEFPAIRGKAYLVQNYEPDFYAPGDPLRLRARGTYGFHPGWKYLTVSGWCVNWLRELYGHEALYVPNGLETDKFFDRQRPMDGKIRILIEGDSSAEHKNVDESFHVVELLEQGKYEIWYMAYHGEPKDWYRVDKFLPQVPYGQVQEVYRQCDILLKSSLLESFSYPPLEMMASGGFVVAVENDGNREYLEDGENCLIYPQGDLEAGAAAIELICRDVQLRERLYAGGQRTAQSREWRQLRQQILENYRKLV